MVDFLIKNNFRGLRSFFISFIFIILFSSPSFTKADTIIDTDLDITQDTVWTKDNGPYLISGYISIESGVTLKIEEGTDVQFQDNTSFALFGGNLDIEGSENGRVNINAIC